MDRESHIDWLRRELAKHEQPCRCIECGSARGELLFLGEMVDGTLTVQQVRERAA